MASIVDVCNQALSHIGSDAIVTAISPPDGSVEAGHCARFVPIARRMMIEQGPWAFAKKRVQLAEVANTSTVWSYAYAKPADCLMPLRVLRAYDFDFIPRGYGALGYWRRVEEHFNESGSADFEVEADVIRTHEPEAVLFYRRDVEDAAKWTPTFTSAFGWMLASYIAGPIVKGTEGMRVAKLCRDFAASEASAGAAADANASSTVHDHLPAFLRNR